MSNKAEIVRDALAENPDLSAPDIAALVYDSHGIEVSAAYVRVVKQRQRDATGDVGQVPELPRRAPVRSAARAVAVLPRAPLPGLQTRLPARADADPLDNATIALIDKVTGAVSRALAGKPQQIRGDQELIGNIVGCLDDPYLQADFPGFRYDIAEIDEGMLALTITGPASEAVARVERSELARAGIGSAKRTRRKGQPAACQFCGKSPEKITTPRLYVVSGGPLNATYLLCQAHAMAECAAGATGRPYELIVNQASGVTGPPSIVAMLRSIISQ